MRNEWLFLNDDENDDSGAMSASRAGPSSRIHPAQSEPDLTSVASSTDSSRRAPTTGPPATPRPAGLRSAAPMTQPVNRVKTRTKSPPPVKPVSYYVSVLCDTYVITAFLLHLQLASI